LLKPEAEKGFVQTEKALPSNEQLVTDPGLLTLKGTLIVVRFVGFADGVGTPMVVTGGIVSTDHETETGLATLPA
jgi:hypothetical protein